MGYRGRSLMRPEERLTTSLQLTPERQLRHLNMGTIGQHNSQGDPDRLWESMVMLEINPSNAQATFEGAKIFENHLYTVLLVFIGKLSRSNLRWIPICQGFSDFSGLLHHFVIGNLATRSIRVKAGWAFSPWKCQCRPTEELGWPTRRGVWMIGPKLTCDRQ